MLKKILCVAAAAVMLGSCSFELPGSKKDTGKAGTSSGASEKDTMPEITLPALPASVNSYGGKILVQSITLKDNYNKTENSIGATVSMMLESESGTCIVDFNILDENGTVVDSGNMGSGSAMSNGETYDGSFYIMGVQPGKKYTMKFIES